MFNYDLLVTETVSINIGYTIRLTPDARLHLKECVAKNVAFSLCEKRAEASTVRVGRHRSIRPAIWFEGSREDIG
jgi:hypothetical protein